MKKIILLIIILTFSLFSCSEDDPNEWLNDSWIYLTYTLRNSNNLYFDKDGTAILWDDYNRTSVISTGKWSFKSNIFTCDIFNIHGNFTKISDNSIILTVSNSSDTIVFYRMSSIPLNQGSENASFLSVSSNWSTNTVNEAQPTWLYFNAIQGNTYYVIWDDSNCTSRVTAYRQNLTTAFFTEIADSSSPQIINSQSTEKIYIIIEGVNMYESGNVGLCIYQ